MEIITDQNRTPSRDWLKFVKTAKARTRIKHWIRTEERARSIALGKEMLEKQGRKDGVNIQKAIKDGSLRTVAEEMSLGGVEELFSAIGYVRVTAKKVIGRLLPARPEATAKAEAEKSRGGPFRGPQGQAIRRRPHPGRGQRAGALRPVLQPPARGPHRRLHQPGPGGDHPHPRLPQRPEPGTGTAVAGKLGRRRAASLSCPHQHPGQEHQGRPGQDFAASGRGGGEHRFRGHPFHVDGTTEILFTVEVTDAAHLYRTIDRISKLDAILEVKRVAVSGPTGYDARGETPEGNDGMGDENQA